MIDTNFIKRKRIELGITLKKMSLKLGYKSINGYWRIEANLTNPSALRLKGISEVLNEPIENLFKNNDEKIVLNGGRQDGN